MAILIKNGTVVDGTGAPGEKKDVYIDGDVIKTIGEVPAARAEKDGARVIDADGKVVCPGFIDMHAHSDFSIPVDGAMEEKIRQGVTTAVIGSCGFSGAPSNGKFKGYMQRYTGGMFGTQCPFAWETTKEYIEYITKKGLGANVFLQTGLGNLRTMVMGIRPGGIGPQQMQQMKEILAQSLDEGSRGFTTGLFYPPQSMCSQEEVTELCKVLKGREGVIYSTHVRNEMDDIENAMQEAIDTAREADVPLEISHHKVILERNYGKVQKTMALIEKARAEGTDVDTDVYPYTAFANIVLPFILKFEAGMEDKILFLYMKHYKELEGKTLAEAMKMKRLGARRLVMQMALREGMSGMPIAGFMMSDDDVDFLVSHPAVSIGSDGVESFGTKTHPRLWGTFPRVLEKYVRADKLITLETAIRKMTSLPARKLSLRRRGELKEGYYADIVVFDPETIREQTTYTDPVKFPTGFETVIVNGKIAALKDVQGGERPGRVL